MTLPTQGTNALTAEAVDAAGNVGVSGVVSYLLAPPNDTLIVGTAGSTVDTKNRTSAIDGTAGNETISAGNGSDVVFAGDSDSITLGNGRDASPGAPTTLSLSGTGLTMSRPVPGR